MGRDGDLDPSITRSGGLGLTVWPENRRVILLVVDWDLVEVISLAVEVDWVLILMGVISQKVGWDLRLPVILSGN